VGGLCRAGIRRTRRSVWGVFDSISPVRSDKARWEWGFGARAPVQTRRGVVDDRL